MKTVIAAALSAAALGAGQADAAAYMKLGDIKGQAKAEGHKDWIEISSVSSAAPASAGRPIIDNEGFAYLSGAIFASRASSQVKKAVAAKRAFPEVRIEFVNEAGEVVLVITMSDVKIASVRSGAAASDDRPTEEVAFYYNKISFNHAATTDGKKGGNVEFEWKVEEGES